jgi:hypothetical protein
MGREQLEKYWIVEELLKAVIVTKEMRLWFEVYLERVKMPDFGS